MKSYAAPLYAAKIFRDSAHEFTIVEATRKQLMKVLHLLDTLNRGGVQTLVLDVCRNARANNLDLTFVATGGGDLEEDFRLSGAEFIRLQRGNAFDLKLIARLRKIIKEQDIQIIHAHQAVEALHAYFATVGTDVKPVLSFHLCEMDGKNRAALKFLIPRLSANVACSHDILNCLAAKSGFDTTKNFRVVYNGVDAKELRAARGRLRAELSLAEKDMLLGMVGNFYPGIRKDQMTVCKALPALFRQVPDAHFVFAGARYEAAPHVYDECVDYCREQGIGNRVHFLGCRSDVPNVLHSLDIFVLSSLWEGLPLACIEAMMIGLPTVVSDIGSLLEVSGGGVCASVFRTKDADDLTHKLLALIKDPTRRAELGAQAQAWATREFSIETHIRNLTKLYGELTNTPAVV